MGWPSMQRGEERERDREASCPAPRPRSLAPSLAPSAPSARLRSALLTALKLLAGRAAPESHRVVVAAGRNPDRVRARGQAHQPAARCGGHGERASSTASSTASSGELSCQHMCNSRCRAYTQLGAHSTAALLLLLLLGWVAQPASIGSIGASGDRVMRMHTLQGAAKRLVTSPSSMSAGWRAGVEAARPGRSPLVRVPPRLLGHRGGGGGGSAASCAVSPDADTAAATGRQTTIRRAAQVSAGVTRPWMPLWVPHSGSCEGGGGA
jgi:hypothetical protein